METFKIPSMLVANSGIWQTVITNKWNSHYNNNECHETSERRQQIHMYR